MTNTDVLCVGNALIDAFLHLHEPNVFARLNKEAGELCFKFGRKIHVDSCDFLLGGNACNVGVGLSRLGLRTSLCVEVGDDEFAQKILHGLSYEPIDTSLLIQTKGEATSFSVGIQYQEERTLFVQHVKRKHDFRFDAVHSKWFYLTSLGYEWKAVYEKVLAHVNKKQTKLAFSPGTHQLEEGRASFEDVLEKTDILFVNKEEANRILYGEEAGRYISSIPQLLNNLAEYGPKMIVLTDGKNGSYTRVETGTIYSLGLFPCIVVGRTGAGDAYASGFLSAIVYGKDVKEAMRWAAANAAGVISGFGAQAGLLTKDEVEKEVKLHEELQVEEIE